MKNNNIKTIIGVILVIVAVIAVVTAAIWALVFQWTNPDMTELRLFLENPYPTIIALVATILFYVGAGLVKEN